jgi:hypothetical protein
LQDDVRASPRLLAVAAVILVAAAIAAFTWVSGSNVAGAASTVAKPAAAQTQPTGHNCPHHGQGDGDSGSGTSQQAAPSSGTASGTEL